MGNREKKTRIRRMGIVKKAGEGVGKEGRKFQKISIGSRPCAQETEKAQEKAEKNLVATLDEFSKSKRGRQPENSHTERGECSPQKSPKDPAEIQG